MAVIKVKGMTCNHCVISVTKALNEIDGVAGVEVSLDKGEASFTEEKLVDMEKVKESIVKAGYEVG